MSKPILYLFNGKIGRIGNVLLSKQEPPPPPDYVQIGDQIWKNTNLALDDGGEGIFIVNGNYYYSLTALNRLNTNLQGSGWHIPSRDEFITLCCYLTGISDRKKTSYECGNMLKSTTGWNGGHNGTNSTGFNALPIGYVSDSNGNVYYDTKRAQFWTVTSYAGGSAAYIFTLDETNYGYPAQTAWGGQSSLSVRLIKDT